MRKTASSLSIGSMRVALPGSLERRTRCRQARSVKRQPAIWLCVTEPSASPEQPTDLFGPDLVTTLMEDNGPGRRVVAHLRPRGVAHHARIAEGAADDDGCVRSLTRLDWLRTDGDVVWQPPIGHPLLDTLSDRLVVRARRPPEGSVDVEMAAEFVVSMLTEYWRPLLVSSRPALPPRNGRPLLRATCPARPSCRGLSTRRCRRSPSSTAGRLHRTASRRSCSSRACRS